MIKRNFINNNFLIIIFSVLIFIFKFYSFQNITLHHDQTFHINWLLNVKNADHFLPPEFYLKFESLKHDTNGFIHELLKPASNPKDYHAYLFQINSLLVVYLFSVIFESDPVRLYILVSVLFSSLSIILNYKILIIILKQYRLYQNSFLTNLTYQLIFIFLNISFYKIFFSPLGHHNIAYFFFSLTILILLNTSLNKLKNFPYIIGSVLGFVSYFQITLVLLLLPFISLFFLCNNLEISSKNFFNFLKFFLTSLIFYFPFIILIINDILSSDKNFFINLIGNNSLNANFYFEKIFFWFEKFYKLGFPIIFFGFFLSIAISVKFKIYNSIQVLVLIHFFINIFLSIFYISYLRNFYYVFNIFIILSSFSLIYLYKKSIFLRIFAILLIFYNFYYNSRIILDVKKLESIDPLFYQLYFDDTNDLKNKILKVKKFEKKNYVFFSDFSKNYFKVYQSDLVNENFLTKKPLRNLYNHQNNKNNDYSSLIIKKFNKINKNFHLISFAQNFDDVSNIIYELKNSSLIDKKCKIQLPHLINETLFRDSVSGKFNINIYLTQFKC
ncbi:hypothetical protein [Candidatus Pelagibacter sp.]|uniref:hypothetical protein n=1 Tax=Candidatus Pelagibacter sp. TaxID=2024849 RepID=UPI003F878F09